MTNLNKIKDIITIIKNPKLYFIVGIITFLVAGIIILLNWKKGKWLLWISISTICNSLMFIIAKLLLPNIIIKILTKTNKKTMQTIITPFVNSFFHNLFIYGLILFGISLIMIIIYIIMQKHSKE